MIGLAENKFSFGKDDFNDLQKKIDFYKEKMPDYAIYVCIVTAKEARKEDLEICRSKGYCVHEIHNQSVQKVVDMDVQNVINVAVKPGKKLGGMSL